MKSNYKKLGEFIRQVDVRNVQDKKMDLLGVSVEKCFINSIANTIGTDWKNYKVIKKRQFCYIPDTSRRGDKIGVALLENFNEALVSQAYSVFEIYKKEQLLPEYLLLWFKRPEFDRYARYHSQGSVREIFDWNEMCNVELPVPSIREQQKIVNSYNAIEKRISILRQINDNLAAFAKCKLIDFFEHTENFDRVPLIKLCTNIMAGGTPSRSNPEYWDRKDYKWVKNGEVKNNIIIDVDEYISHSGLLNSSAKIIPPFSVLMAMYCVSTPQLAINTSEVTTNQAVCAMICPNQETAAFIYYYLMFFGQDLINDANGSAQVNLSKETISQYVLPKLTDKQLLSLNLTPTILYRMRIEREIQALKSLQANLTAALSR